MGPESKLYLWVGEVAEKVRCGRHPPHSHVAPIKPRTGIAALKQPGEGNGKGCVALHLQNTKVAAAKHAAELTKTLDASFQRHQQGGESAEFKQVGREPVARLLLGWGWGV